MLLDATSTRVINAIKEVYSKMIEDLDRANGYYRIYKTEAGKYPDIVGWKKTDLIKPDDYVTLTVRMSGGTYFFFLNKVLVHKMPFVPFFGQQIGFQCGKSSATIVDYLRISYLK